MIRGAGGGGGGSEVIEAILIAISLGSSHQMEKLTLLLRCPSFVRVWGSQSFKNPRSPQ